MSAESSQKEQDTLWILADSLSGLRDALVQISLLLQETRFQLDGEKRNAAAEHLKSFIEKINVR